VGRKSLSQYFLTSAAIARRIAGCLKPVAEDAVILEIGGGRGILTDALRNLNRKLIIVEIDTALAEKLRNYYSNDESVNIINKDILKVDPGEIGQRGNIYLAGNIPYHISGLILRWISDHHEFFRRVVLMLQKEVARRICSQEGNRDYGVLTVVLALDFKTELLFTVKAENFSPVPKVDSAVIELALREKSLIENASRDRFNRLVKTAFAQRRKKLRNALAGYKPEGDESVADIIIKAGLDPDIRPDKLSVNDYLTLFEKFNDA
jgi:16S rRNA (adenine1518-N6/adenine1519-N6)-dimethyltransferase